MPSPGLEPPLPPLIVIPEHRRHVCACGQFLTTRDEVGQGCCDECFCRSAILHGEPALMTRSRAERVDRLLSHHLAGLITGAAYLSGDPYS